MLAFSGLSGSPNKIKITLERGMERKRSRLYLGLVIFHEKEKHSQMYQPCFQFKYNNIFCITEKIFFFCYFSLENKMSENIESSVLSVNPLMWIESIKVVDNSSGLHHFLSLLLRGSEENVKIVSNMTEFLSKFRQK